MATNLLKDRTRTFSCKHLPELPPIVNAWQQSCKQPRCRYYRRGECSNSDRYWSFAKCPFDGKELALDDAEEIVQACESLGDRTYNSHQQPAEIMW